MCVYVTERVMFLTGFSRLLFLLSFCMLNVFNND